MFVRPLNLKPEHFLKILFIADEDIDVRNELLRHLNCFLAGPELAAEIQIIAHDRSGLVGCFHRLIRHIGTAVAQGGENTAGVEPSNFSAVENALPVHIRGFHVLHRGVSAVVHRYAGADTNSYFGEIQSDSIRTTRAVVGNPDNLAHIHAAGTRMIFDESSQGVINKARDPSCPHPIPR